MARDTGGWRCKHPPQRCWAAGRVSPSLSTAWRPFFFRSPRRAPACGVVHPAGGACPAPAPALCLAHLQRLACGTRSAQPQRVGRPFAPVRRLDAALPLPHAADCIPSVPAAEQQQRPAMQGRTPASPGRVTFTSQHRAHEGAHALPRRRAAAPRIPYLPQNDAVLAAPSPCSSHTPSYASCTVTPLSNVRRNAGLFNCGRMLCSSAALVGASSLQGSKARHTAAPPCAPPCPRSVCTPA